MRDPNPSQSLFRASRTLGLTTARLVILLVLSFLAAAFEIFGVSIFIPIFQYVRTAGDIESLVSEFPLWAELIRIFDFLGLNLSLTVLLLTAFSLFLIRQLFLFLRLVITATIQTKIVKDWRDKLFLKYFSTKIELQDKMPIGQLIASLTTELPRAAVAVFAPVELAVHTIVLGVYLAFLAVISWQMTLAGLLLMGIAGWLPKYWSGLGRITGVSLTEANLTMSDFLLTRLLSPRLLRISQTLPQEFQKFQSITASQRKFFFRGALLRSKVEISIEPFVIAISLGFIFFSYTILDFSIEIIGVYLVVIIRLLPVIKNGFAAWFQLQSAFGAVEEVLSRDKLLSKNVEKGTGKLRFPRERPIFTFDKVSYRYPSRAGEFALLDISCTIEPNLITGIVGPSGSGKSTFIDLIPKLREPSSGRIYLNGINLEEYDTQSLRGAIAFAPQDPDLMPGSILDHINYGNPEASRADIVHAASLAKANDFISALPHGYETDIGADGGLLSGGQRQRIDLARVFLKAAPILIFDEPTSSLDKETEEEFFEAISSYHQQTKSTIIIISHERSILRRCHKVIYLDAGRLVENL